MKMSQVMTVNGSATFFDKVYNMGVTHTLYAHNGIIKPVYGSLSVYLHDKAWQGDNCHLKEQHVPALVQHSSVHVNQTV